MHFSIPDTETAVDSNGTGFTSFNIHINGVFHCSVRYSVLHAFHEQLKKELGATLLPPFPPKKFFPLSSQKLDERRSTLEKFVQVVSQDPRISNSDVFNGFLLSAQQETQKEASEDVTLDVFLMNGHKITVKIKSTDQTEDVLEGISSQIDLIDEYVYYFGLFLVQKEDDGDNSIVRKLQDFESPFISLKYANKVKTHRIVLRKSFWDLSYEDELLADKVAMNLLYVQAVNDIERQWTLGTKEQLKHLTTLHDRGSKKEYLRLCRTLKYYGYIHFKPCVTDYPQPNSRALVAIGNKELSFRVQTAQNVVKEGTFRITRMRCWRITTSGLDTEDGDHSRPARLELAFEYLMSRDSLQWITIASDQAILMSMCLQSVVDELVRKKQGKKIKRPQDRNKSTPVVRTLQREDSYANVTSRQNSAPSPTEDKPGLGNGNSMISNTAFDNIGDDDL